MKPKFSELLKKEDIKLKGTRKKDIIEEREAVRQSQRVQRKQEFKNKKGKK